MHPVLKYPGAKWRLASWIISHMPPHESYLEPFFGSGALFFNKDPSRLETINDIDGCVAHFFRTCREYPDELAYAVSMTPWAREEFLDCDFLNDANPTDDVEWARQFLVRCWMTFGARMRCKTTWRHSTGKGSGGPDNPKLWRRLPEVIIQVSDRLLDAQIDNRPAIDVIKRFNAANVLIYADPPYMTETRTLSGGQYRYEMTNIDHQELLAALLKHEGMVLLSGYDNDLYNDLLRGWRKETIDTQAELGVRRTECLWMNPAVLESRGMRQTAIGAAEVYFESKAETADSDISKCLEVLNTYFNISYVFSNVKEAETMLRSLEGKLSAVIDEMHKISRLHGLSDLFTQLLHGMRDKVQEYGIVVDDELHDVFVENSVER